MSAWAQQCSGASRDAPGAGERDRWSGAGRRSGPRSAATERQAHPGERHSEAAELGQHHDGPPELVQLAAATLLDRPAAVNAGGTTAIIAARQGSGADDLYGIDLRNGAVEQLTDTSNVDEKSPAFLPDGRVVVAGTRPLLERHSLDPSFAFIGTIDLATRAIAHLDAPNIYPVTVGVSSDGTRLLVASEADPTHDSVEVSVVLGNFGGHFHEFIHGSIPWATLSPDGHSVCYWDGRRVLVTDARRCAGRSERCSYVLSRGSGGAGRPVMGHSVRASAYQAMRCRSGWWSGGSADRSKDNPEVSGSSWARPAAPILATCAGGACRSRGRRSA